MAARHPETAKDEEADWAWAREHARQSPRWSDALWRQLNALLDLEVTTGRARLGEKPP
jgi:hypothetical protein